MLVIVDEGICTNNFTKLKQRSSSDLSTTLLCNSLSLVRYAVTCNSSVSSAAGAATIDAAVDAVDAVVASAAVDAFASAAAADAAAANAAIE